MNLIGVCDNGSAVITNLSRIGAEPEQPLFIYAKDPFDFPTIGPKDPPGWELWGSVLKSELTPDFIFPGRGYAVIATENGEDIIGIFERCNCSRREPK